MAVDTHPVSLAPPGVTPNYVNPYTISNRVIIVNLVLMLVSLGFVTARLMIRWLLVKKLSIDDGFIAIAMGLIVARATVATISASKYGLGYHIWDIPPQEIVWKGDIQKNLLFTADMLYLLSIMFIKLAFLTLYVQLFGIKKTFKYLCYTMMAAVVIYCITFFFIEAFNCNPVARNWHALTYQGKWTCFDNDMVEFVIGGFNIGTDLIILLLPVPPILSLQVTSSKKLGLLAIFSTGVFVVVSTIVREVIVVRTLSNFDSSWSTVPESIWLTIENDVGIISACLPSFAPLRKTNFFGKVVPSSIRYLLDKSGLSSQKSSANTSSLRQNMGFHRAESSVELVKQRKGNGSITRTTDVAIAYCEPHDPSSRV